MKSKYNSKKVEYAGIKFDSETEKQYYCYLKEKERAGELTFTCQPEVMLVPSFRLPCGTLQRAITYTPDFKVMKGGYTELIDIKGMAGQASTLRRKLYNFLIHQLPPDRQVPLRWIARSIKHGDADGWCDWDDLQKIRRKNRKDKAE